MKNYYKSYAKRKGIENYTLKFATFIHKNYFKKPGLILDIGCGAGYYMSAFNSLGYKTYGIDNDSEALKISSKHGGVTNIDLSKSIKLPFKDNTFDFVFIKSVLEHTFNPEEMIKEINRVCKSRVFILVPAYDTKRYQIDFYSDPTHISPRTTKELIDSCKDFKIIKFRRFVNLPFIWRFTDLAFRINGLHPDDNFLILEKK